MSKDSFILFKDQKEVINALSDEQAGKIIKSIFHYIDTGKIDIDDELKCIFTIFKIKIDEYFKRSHKEEYHWNWQGGITKENHLIRNSTLYKDWRKRVFERDNFTCQRCLKRGGKLNAHHIEKFSKNIKKRFDVNNGITLCTKCHREVHKNER